MDHATITKLIEQFGLIRTAELILGKSKTLTEAQQGFFLEHWNGLDDRLLLGWLMTKPPDEAQTRPPGITPRAAEWLVARSATDPLFRLEVSGRIEGITDELARDDVIECLHGRIPDDAWLGLLPLAAGCTPFVALAQLEFGNDQRRNTCPYKLVEGHGIPIIRERLFDLRREPDKCIGLLRSMIDDPMTRVYVLWALQAVDLLKEIVTPGMLLGDLPAISEVDPDERPKIRYQLALANELAAHHDYKAAVVHRILAASARGVPWGHLWHEIPEPLRDDVGIASINTPTPAPWSVAAVGRQLSGMAAWQKVLDRFELPESPPEDEKDFYDGASYWLGQIFPKVHRDPGFRPLDDTKWLTSYPLPKDADEAFEERLADALRRFHADDFMIADRLSKLPLERARARRLLETTLSDGSFYRLKRCAEIAEAAGPLENTVPRPKQWDDNAVRAYELLAGDGAVARWFDQSIEAGDFWQAYHLAKCDESLRSTVRIEALRHLLPRDDLRSLVRLHEDSAWLLSVDDVTHELTSGEFDDEQWMHLGVVPDYLVPVVELKVIHTGDARVAGELLQILKDRKVDEKKTAAVAVDRVKRHGTASIETWRLGSLLASGKLWSGPGRDLIDHVLRDTGNDGVWWLFLVAWRSHEEKPTIVQTLHGVFAEVMIDIAAGALRKSDGDRAEQCLRALASLTAPPRLFRSVRALKELTDDPDLKTLVEANEGLMAEADDESANMGTLEDALKEFTSAPEGGAS